MTKRDGRFPTTAVSAQQPGVPNVTLEAWNPTVP
jgi:hypothetical protein